MGENKKFLRHKNTIVLTFSSVKAATIMGEKIPGVVPTQLMMPYKVPAKLGAKSWLFCKLEAVAAPLKPNEMVIIATQT